MIESWAPVIAAGIIVVGAAAVQLGIYLHTIRERRRDRERKRVNAVKDLYWGLSAMVAQGWFTAPQTSKIDPRSMFLLYPEDIGWLRRHFHENGHLFSPKLHDQYQHDITDTETRPMLIKEEHVPQSIRKFVSPSPVFGGNLTRLYLAAKEELRALNPSIDLPAETWYVPKSAYDAMNSGGG